MNAAGLEATAVYLPGWRGMKSSVEKLLKELKPHLTAAIRTAVYYLVDNSTFFARTEDGSTIPTRRCIDGAYHMDSELVVASKDINFQFLRVCMPLWDLASGRRMVVFSPSPRYVSASCCHIPNCTNHDFLEKMCRDQKDVRTHIKKFFFYVGMHNVIPFDPMVSMPPLTLGEIWDESNLIHPCPKVYRRIADGLKIVLGARMDKREASPPWPVPARGRDWSNSGQAPHSTQGCQDLRDVLSARGGGHRSFGGSH